MIIGVDFDGTCVEHVFPEMGGDVPGAVHTLRALVDAGHHLILWTMRSDDTLAEAVAWFEERGIPLLGANRNPGQSSWTNSPKAYCNLYIDDAAFGCPLVHPDGVERAMVDWFSVSRGLSMRGLLPIKHRPPVEGAAHE